MSHGHSHQGGCDHTDEAKPEEDFGVQFNLYQKINLEEVECLNEATEGSGKKVFKPYEKRHQRDEFVISDADEELLFNVPFTGYVKLKGVIVIGGEDGKGPNKMRLFKNRPHLTFDDVSGLKADQEFDLVQDNEGRIQYPTKVVQFNSVHHLTIHFPSNYAGDDETKIFYIGLRGDFFQAQRTGVVNAVYEARPMLGDHKQDVKDLSLNANNPQF